MLEDFGQEVLLQQALPLGLLLEDVVLQIRYSLLNYRLREAYLFGRLGFG